MRRIVLALGLLLGLCALSGCQGINGRDPLHPTTTPINLRCGSAGSYGPCFTSP